MEGYKKEVFCPQCRGFIKPKIVKIPTFTGELIIEYHCPKHGLLETEKRRMRLPSRRIPEAGVYIAIEGIDGSGKTTQAILLHSHFEKNGYDAVLVKEPWIKAIKEFLYKYDVDPDAEAYIFAADRIILQKEVVIPALEEKKIVVSDRSIYASLAYQGARGLDQEFILAINRHIRHPDVVVLLDLPVEEALDRIVSRKVKTRFEDPEFLEKVRQIYLGLAERYREKFVVVDASRSVRETFSEILEKLRERLSGKVRL